MEHKYITSSAFQTKKIGAELAKKVLKLEPQKRAIILALRGDLGGGKTTFLQGFARGLGIEERILSPTFVILKKFKITKTKNQKTKTKNTNQNLKTLKYKNFYHIDCYRVQKPKEILDLGFKKILSNPKNIVAIEWADRVLKIVPKNAIWLGFEFIDANRRQIVVKYPKNLSFVSLKK